jgi:hypothetical protein
MLLYLVKRVSLTEFENMSLRATVGPKREKSNNTMMEKLHNENLHGFYPSSKIVTIFK